MSTSQLVTLIIAISALLGHVPAAVKALQSLTGRNSGQRVQQGTGNASQQPPAAS